MKEYDWSDRKLKIGVVLALVIIGWLCHRGAGASQPQTTLAHESPDGQEIVKVLLPARMPM